jgi:pyridoxal 5'-phosphate synthase pdxT subunit
VNLIGVLALQGDFEKHLDALSALKAKCIPVRSAEELQKIDGIILPGGESTTIGMLLDRFAMLDPLREMIRKGLPVFATCAGMILLAKEIEGSSQPHLGVMDISIQRNAYGPQIESFETDIHVPLLGDDPVKGVFIRAPITTRFGEKVSILATFEGKPVLIRESNMLAAAFHPELAGELRIHRYFMESM